MSATELTSIKAALKSWEKAFRVEFGREPTKLDIKNDPAIAAKYKLYSKARVVEGSSSQWSSKANKRPEVAQEVPSTPRKVKRDTDTFKTPSKPSSTAAEKEPVTDFAYAPSPSRLRALAAARSFSGSPNNVRKRPSDIAQEHASSSFTELSHTPRDFRIPLIVPRDTSIATPKRKALRWLSGEASPFQNMKRTDTSLLPSNDHVAALQARDGDPSVLRDSAAQALASSRRSLHDESEANILGPSPARAKLNGRGRKSHQQAYLDLLEEAELDAPYDGATAAAAAATTTTMTSTARQSDPGATAKASWLSVGIDNEMRSTRSLSQSKLDGYSRPRKRNSAAAALMPFDGMDDGHAEDALAMIGDPFADTVKSPQADVEISVAAKRRRADKGKVPQMDQPDTSVYADPGATSDPIAETGERSSDSLGDYETRDLDDMYDVGEEDTFRKSKGLHVVSEKQVDQPQPDSRQEVAVDADLLDLLSLRSSPVNKRLHKMHAKRDRTFKALLQEPTYVLAKKREQEAKGLEDLVDETNGSDGGYNDERQEELDVAQMRRLRLAKAEDSDDDWDSEPEGWKDLGDGEMDDMNGSS